MINKYSYNNKRKKEIIGHLKHNVIRFYELCGINMFDIDKKLRYQTMGFYKKEKLKIILFKFFYNYKIKVKNYIRDIHKKYILKDKGYPMQLSRFSKMKREL